MKRTLLIISLLCLSGSMAPAGESPEAIWAGAGAAFYGLAGFKPQPPKIHRLEARQARKAPGNPPHAPRRWIRLSGFVSLNGTAFVAGRTIAYITVWGWTQLYDQDGHALEGQILMSDTLPFYTGDLYLSGWARPYAYVSVYEDGKLLGTTRVEGSVFVSGYNNNGWVSLSGIGDVHGDLPVPDSLKKP